MRGGELDLAGRFIGEGNQGRTRRYFHKDRNSGDRRRKLLRLAGPGLDALTLGEGAACSLGVDPRRLQALLIAGTGLTVGSGVAVAGIVGFVGLIVPHLVRPLTDRRPSSLIVPSALAGALLVLVADCLCRVLPLVTELRLGIALSLVGAPFFLALLLRMRREVIE